LPKQYGDFSLFLRLVGQAGPYRPHLAAAALVSLVSTPLALLTPVPLAIAVDSVIGSKELPGFLDAVAPASDDGRLLFAVGLLFLVSLLHQIQQLTSSVLDTYTGEKLQLEFRRKLFAHVQRLSLAYHDTRGTADATYRIQYDAPAIQWILVYGLTPFATSLLTLASMIYVTSRLDLQLALVALTIVPVLLVLAQASRRRLRSGWMTTKKVESSALSVVQEVLTSLRVVKAFVREKREDARFVEQSTVGMRGRVRLTAVEELFGLGVGATTAAGTALVLFLGVRHVQAGELSLGGLLLVMTYLLQLYEPLQVMAKSLATLQTQFSSAERVFAVLDEAPDVPERPRAAPLRRASGGIEFQEVSFAYPGGENVLHGLSFSVKPGERLGIAGATGSGKTTLASLLLRLYDPTAGRILLDGHDLRDYRVADLRGQFAVVLQEPVLFATSIAENIGYGRDGARTHQIVAAARAANAHEFIERLPEGYDTLVGERGMRLSGGERQRISLARAFLKDAPILVLDEPTSSVDVRTETAIMATMEHLMDGRTTLMIAHRLGTLEYCDTRIEIEDGRIIQSVGRGVAL